MTDISKLRAVVECLEPALEEVMRFHPIALPEGLRLRTSICGFASSTLAKYLDTKGLARSVLRIGFPVDKVSVLPSRMWQHVVVNTERAILDPTWGQFMALVGLDVNLAARNLAMNDLYPERRVAVIPKGSERLFGERFAEYALGRVATIANIRRAMGPDTPYSTDDVCVWSPADEAFEMLADIWNPDRYTDLADWGNEESVRLAVDRLSALSNQQS